MLTVHLRISDVDTKQPVAVRLRVTDASGNYFPPLGRPADFPLGHAEAVGGSVRVGKESFAFVDGGCELPLPAEVPLRVQAYRGPEWEPLDRTVTLGPGQMALRFEMARWFDRRAEGWVSGDSRAHHIAPHAALLEAAAEDLDVVNLLARVYPILAADGNTYPTLPNLTAFSGQKPALEADGRVVAVNTYHTHPTLGRVALLHCHRVVFPLAAGGADGPDDWSVADWCDQCHRKNGLAVWCESDGGPGGEALAALVLGKVDAVEFDPRPRKSAFLPWLYRLWDAGFDVPLVGGSAKESNRTPLGAVRTYAKMNDPTPQPPPPAGAGEKDKPAHSSPNSSTLSPRGRVASEARREGSNSFLPAWVEGVRGGRTFVTNGPLLRFAVDGSKVTASAESITPFERVEIVGDGKVLATGVVVAGARTTAAVEVDLPAGCGWVAARCIGGVGSRLFPEQPAFAHTSAVRVAPRVNPAAVAALRSRIEETREWVDTRGQFTAAKFKAQHLDLCDRALARLNQAAV